MAYNKVVSIPIHHRFTTTPTRIKCPLLLDQILRCHHPRRHRMQWSHRLLPWHIPQMQTSRAGCLSHDQARLRALITLTVQSSRSIVQSMLIPNSRGSFHGHLRDRRPRIPTTHLMQHRKHPHRRRCNKGRAMLVRQFHGG